MSNHDISTLALVLQFKSNLVDEMYRLSEKKTAWFALAAISLSWLLALWAQEFSLARVFFEERERFTDFILVVYAVPHGFSLPLGFESISEFFAHHPGYRNGRFTIMHLPPFSMLLTVLTSKLFQFISPTILFIIFSVVLMLWLFAIVRRTAPAPIAYVATLSYPVAFMIDRGNLYAGLCGVCLVAALVRRKADFVGVILFAVALNVRPNVLPMLLPLLIYHRRINWRFGVEVGLATLMLGVISAILAHALYSEYTVSSFRHGMDLYLKGTLESPLMLAFGSSAYSALYALGIPSLVARTVLAALVGG